MNTDIHACDHDRLDALLAADHVGPEADALLEHLETCASCRAYMDARAATPDEWARAAELLPSSIFDHAGSAEYSAATVGAPAPDRPRLIEQVLADLAPSDDPHRLSRLDGYEISGVIGAGGMGVVLKAFDRSLDRVVAIKVMAPHLAHDEAARRRFAREAKAAAAVLHPNVIPIHGVVNDGPAPDAADFGPGARVIVEGTIGDASTNAGLMATSFVGPVAVHHLEGFEHPLFWVGLEDARIRLAPRRR